MSLFDSIFIPSSQQTPEEAQANYSRQLALLQAQGQAPPPGDAPTLEDPGAAASQTFWGSLNPLSSPPNDGTATPGIFDVFKDLFVLVVIGGALWLFFEFGGVSSLKTLTTKSKYAVWGIVAGAVILAYVIYSRFKKTAGDTASTVSGVKSGLAALNPFSSN